MQPIDPNLILTRLENGTLIRDSWGDGGEVACLLVAVSPEVGSLGRSEDCPATLMPMWLANLTPWIDDSGTEFAWQDMVRRYAAVAARWHVLDESAWEDCERRVKVALIEDALTSVADDLFPDTVALCRRAGRGLAEGALGEALCFARELEEHLTHVFDFSPKKSCSDSFCSGCWSRSLFRSANSRKCW